MPYILKNSADLFPDFGNISKWLAVGGSDPASHIWMNLQRVDSSSTSLSDSSGNFQLASITDPPSSLTVGGKIYCIFYTAGSVVVAEGLYNIVSFSGSTLVVDCPYSALASFARFSFITDYANYYFRIEYTLPNGDVVKSIHTFSPTTLTYADVSAFTKDYVSITSKAIPTSVNNDIADNIDAYVSVAIYEIYDGPDGHVDALSDGDNIDMYIVNAANQLQNVNGVSLVDKITNDTPSQLLKFLTDFIQPTLFKGYPFHTSFIYSSLMTSVVAYDYSCYDGAGSLLLNANPTLSAGANLAHVNRLFFRASIPDATKTIDVFLKKNVGGTPYSETMTVRYKYCGGGNAVCLKWMGISGAWNYWVFSGNNTENLEVTAPQGVFEPFITNLAISDTDSDFVTKDTSPELELSVDNIDQNDLNGLKTLLQSPKVMMLTNPDTWIDDGVDKWVTVKVKTGKFKIKEARAKLGGLQFAIALPQVYIQTN